MPRNDGDPQYGCNILAVVLSAIFFAMGWGLHEFVAHTTAIADYNMRTNYSWDMASPHDGGDYCTPPPVPNRADFDDPAGKTLEAPDLRL